MKSLIKSVKDMSLKSKAKGNSIDFLDHSLKDPMCQKIIQQMNNINLEEIGVRGQSSATDDHHF